MTSKTNFRLPYVGSPRLQQHTLPRPLPGNKPLRTRIPRPDVTTTNSEANPNQVSETRHGLLGLGSKGV